MFDFGLLLGVRGLKGTSTVGHVISGKIVSNETNKILVKETLCYSGT